MQNAQQLQIGQPIGGGFFAGIISLAGEHHGIIVAPKAEGESTPMEWGSSGKPIEAISYFDGDANTRAMAEAESELAKWALGLEIDGHSDWYIPSRDELELLYRNLKPTTQENYGAFRDGENPSSVPVHYPYSETAPTQTSVEMFRAGNAEALETAFYWSSTQSSAYTAWLQIFDNGNQYNYHKDFQARARAVRRFKLTI